MDKKYELLFEGDCSEGKSLQEVKTNLGKLLGCSQDKIESMFQHGTRTRIKRDLDHDKAVAAQRVFEKTGARCRIVASPAKQENLPQMAPRKAPVNDLPPTPITPLTTPRKFYFPLQLRLAIIFLPVVLLLCPFLLPFRISDLPTEGVTVLGAVFASIFLFCIYAAWRFWQPAITLSEQGVEQLFTRFFTREFVTWDDIKGMAVIEHKFRGKNQKSVKLVVSHERGKTREWTLAISGVSNGEEVLAILQQRIPEPKPQDHSPALEQLKPLQVDRLSYRDLMVSRKGLLFNGEMITWDRVSRLATEGFVIAGYGSVAVTYTGAEKPLIVKASTKRKYLDCIQLIVSLAHDAAVDPGVMQMLKYPVSSAQRDNVAVALLILGIPLAIVGLVILAFYPPTVGATWLYPLLLIPFGLAPFVWTIMLLSKRFQGGGGGPSRKIFGAALFNIGTVLSVALLFSISPASFLWLLADTSAMTGQLTRAETFYLKAEPELGANEDFVFTLGQFYSLKHDWNRAAEYYIRSYEMDPTNWMPEPLESIPETLSKAGRHTEALQWCERIKSQYVWNNKVIRVIERRQKIIQSRLGSSPATN